MSKPAQTIYDIAIDSTTVTVKGVTVPVYKLGARKLAAMAKRFPDAEFLQNLTAPGKVGDAGQTTFELSDLEIVIAMVTAALGYTNDPNAEEQVEQAFPMDALGEILQKSMELTGATADEGFGKRSG